MATYCRIIIPYCFYVKFIFKIGINSMKNVKDKIFYRKMKRKLIRRCYVILNNF